MRLFIALDISSDIRQRISDFRDSLKSLAPRLRWTSAENFHLNLQFRGETTKVDEVRNALESLHCAPVSLSFRGSGFFPNPRFPRLFWAGIEPDEHLRELVQAIAAVMRPLGFEADSGAFTPHLTLARAGGSRSRPRGQADEGMLAVRLNAEQLGAQDFGTMTAKEFCLYESMLSPSGSKYLRLAQYRLE